MKGGIKMEEDEKVVVNMIDNFQQLLMEEGISEEEKEKRIKEHLKPFSGNLKTIIEDIEQTKKEQDKEIEFHEEFIKILESLSQYPEAKELMQKENELIIMLENEKLFSEKFYLASKSFLDIISFIRSEDLASTSKKKSKLQYEINIITEDLREKGIIKR